MAAVYDEVVTNRPIHANGEHVVKIYDDDRDLIDGAADFLAEGLIAGESALVVATGSHREGLEAAARARGVDATALSDAGQYLATDAREMLTRFMCDGSVGAQRFHDEIGDLLSAVRGRRVRVFGEMVALLWGSGNVVAALEVETRWNALASQREFSLYCAYAVSQFGPSSDLSALRDVCMHHSGVLAPRSYEVTDPGRSPAGPDTRPTELFFPTPLAVRAARNFVRDTLGSWDAHALVERAVLITSEFATNAVVHARSPFRVSIKRGDGTVTLEVQDGGDGSVRAKSAAVDVPGGRGLAMVDSICPAWGSERVADGTVVWAELSPD